MSEELKQQCEFLIETVCIYFNISKEVLLSESKKGKISDIRHIVMFILSREYGLRDSEIGEILNRSRSSVWSGICKINNLKIFDKEIRIDIGKIIYFLDNPDKLTRKIEVPKKEKQKQKIYQLDLNMNEIASYDSVREACLNTGVSRDTIRRSLKSYRREGRGYYWIKK